ncbi:unnamed protein product, partial [Staurois parvus]
MRSSTVLCRNNAAYSVFFLQPERTGIASTDVNYDIDNHITYFLCVLDGEKKQLKRMYYELALKLFV